MQEFISLAEQKTGKTFDNYHALWQWSIDDISAFWSLVWDYCHIIGLKKAPVVIEKDHMINTSWFPNATLNYAENVLKRRDHGDAIVFWGEDKVRQTLSHKQLYESVAKCQKCLLQLGVQKGDKVVGYLPNIPEAIIAMLATSAIGAVWSSASPDFGVEGVIDRFSQLKPKILFCVDGYYYNNKNINKHADNKEIAQLLPTLQHTITVSYTQASIDTNSHTHMWNDVINSICATEVHFAKLPFNHPLFIMFSSGTTGVPKCIIHSAGGTLIQHLKEHKIHCDIKTGDRLFYFTICGWMMWNWLATGLASNATLMLYDGSPFAANNNIIFDYIETEKITHLGVSAKFIEYCRNHKVLAKNTHDLQSLRIIMSTGSPLSAVSYDYIYSNIKKQIAIFSISGGTDIISCFALGCPILPIHKEELQCRGLGMAVDVFDENGTSVKETKGELVCTRTFPSMPIGFLGDNDNSKYLDAYFTKYPNIWCHGDFVKLTKHNGLIIYGRSDTVLNPQGVRIGTAEIYRQVECVDEVLESVVVGQEKDNDVRIILFVKLKDGIVLDKILSDKIKAYILKKTTHRHVPAKIIQVPDIPRTKSGKIVELAVKNIIHGKAVTNTKSLANPESLAHFPKLA